jgi:hypothetical protein
VADRGNNRIQRFSSAGTYISQFNGSAAPTGALVSPTAIAVDNSTSPLDPSAGDVYVIDTGHKVVDKFSAGGTYLGQISTGASGAPFGELFGVAVDPNGLLWAYQESKEIDSYSNAPANVFLSSREMPLGTSPGFAVDSEDNLYANRGDQELAKLNSSGSILMEAVETTTATAAAVEPASNDVYIDNVETVGVFSPAGVLVERFGSGQLSGGSGIAVYPKDGAVYVADSANNRVDVFVPEPPGKPSVGAGTVFASAVTQDSADLHATINPHGAETTYYFQYGTVNCSTSPSQCVSVPTAPGAVTGSGFGAQPVNAHIQGLAAGATYYYRVVAVNAFGEVEGHSASATFTTLSGGAFTLPDGRAWELVSPPDKHGGLLEPLQAEGGVLRASADGTAITYLSNQAVVERAAGEANLSQTVAQRSSGGWLNQDISTPHEAMAGKEPGTGQEYRFFSPDLSLAAVAPRGATPLAPDASEKTLYLRERDGSYKALVTAGNVRPGAKFGDSHLEFVSATSDLSHIIISSLAALTPNAVAPAAAHGLYEWAEGHLQLVSLLPNGKPASEVPDDAKLGTKSNNVRHAISEDGSRVFWEAQGAENNGEPNQLYMRDMRRGETLRLDVLQPGAEGGNHESNEVRFQTASADGTRAFFTDERRLTVDSHAESFKPDLYECEIVEVAEKLTCRLADLTKVSAAGESADIQGPVLGADDAGSYVYFVATGVLSQGATNGADNLYMLHNNGKEWEPPRLIAALSSGDEPDWGGQQQVNFPGDLFKVTSRVSPNGRYLAFMSENSLTGYDNLDAKSGTPDEELFLYDAVTNRLVCPSCNPTGARPSGIFDSKRGLLADPTEGAGGYQLWGERWVAALIPGWNGVDVGHALYQSRYLSNSGRLYFDSSDRLAPQPVSGKMEVYEYQPPGAGSCSSSSDSFHATSAGCVDLISSGTSDQESAFLDASESGGDVFFLTAARLTSQDRDEQLDVYDAHECTPTSPCVTGAVPAETSPCASGETCRPTSTPAAAFGEPATATFSGGGNFLTEQVLGSTHWRPRSRAEKLAAALRACRTRYATARKRRQGCERHARWTYRTKPARTRKRGG